jgi:hypothetical protein
MKMKRFMNVLGFVAYGTLFTVAALVAVKYTTPSLFMLNPVGDAPMSQAEADFYSGKSDVFVEHPMKTYWEAEQQWAAIKCKIKRFGK